MSGPTHLEGIAGHRRLQKSRGQDWQVEYALKQTLTIENYAVTLQGRADLINATNSPVIVEEIKTTYFPPERLAAEKLDLYRAQAKVYAYLYHLSEKIEARRYDIHVSLFNLLDGKVHTEKTTTRIDELEHFTSSLCRVIKSYHCW